jgi:hypothetical protein
VHRHLITVEVGVERSTDKGVYPNRLPFNQHRLERLNAEPMKRGCPVEQHGVILNDLLENLVYIGTLSLNDFLGALNRFRDALLDELVNDERLEQLHSHRLGQATLVQAKLGTHHNNRPPGVVHPLT